jgi:hypothetical protein
MDPHRLVPIVEELRDNIGLRLAAPHVSESVRDLDRWSGGLREAGRIDGVDAVKGTVEELQVRISK